VFSSLAIKVTAEISKSFVNNVGQQELRELLDKLRQTMPLDVLYLDSHYTITGSWTNIKTVYNRLADKLPNSKDKDVGFVKSVEDEVAYARQQLAFTNAASSTSVKRLTTVGKTQSKKSVGSARKSANDDFVSLSSASSVRDVSSVSHEHLPVTTATVHNVPSRNSISLSVDVNLLEYMDNFCMPEMKQIRDLFDVNFARSKINDETYLFEISSVSLENAKKIETAHGMFLNFYEAIKKQITVDMFDTSKIKDFTLVRNVALHTAAQYIEVYVQLRISKQICVFVGQPIPVRDAKLAFIQMLSPQRQLWTGLNYIQQNNSAGASKSALKSSGGAEPLARRCSSLESRVVTFGLTTTKEVEIHRVDSSTTTSTQRGSIGSEATRDSDAKLLTPEGSQVTDNSSVAGLPPPLASKPVAVHNVNAASKAVLAGRVVEEPSEGECDRMRSQGIASSSANDATVSSPSAAPTTDVASTSAVKSVTVPTPTPARKKYCSDEIEMKLVKSGKFSYADKLALMQRSGNKALFSRIQVKPKIKPRVPVTTATAVKTLATPETNSVASKVSVTPMSTHNAVMPEMMTSQTSSRSDDKLASNAKSVMTKLSSTAVREESKPESALLANTEDYKNSPLIFSDQDNESFQPVQHLEIVNGESQLKFTATALSVHTNNILTVNTNEQQARISLSTLDSGMNVSNVIVDAVKDDVDSSGLSGCIQAALDDISPTELGGRSLPMESIEECNHIAENFVPGTASTEQEETVAAVVHSEGVHESFIVNAESNCSLSQKGLSGEDLSDIVVEQDEMPTDTTDDPVNSGRAISQQLDGSDKETDSHGSPDEIELTHDVEAEQHLVHAAFLANGTSKAIAENTFITGAIKEEACCVVCSLAVSDYIEENEFLCHHVFCGDCAARLRQDVPYAFDTIPCPTCVVLSRGAFITQPKDGTFSKIVDPCRDVAGFRGLGCIIVQVSFKAGTQEKVNLTLFY
jgi:hypothetical protein